tara:strand:- start:2934 stop:4565 length:1632 start_codon:yes stop_codon:yes gene_type:complete
MKRLIIILISIFSCNTIFSQTITFAKEYSYINSENDTIIFYPALFEKYLEYKVDTTIISNFLSDRYLDILELNDSTANAIVKFDSISGSGLLSSNILKRGNKIINALEQKKELIVKEELVLVQDDYRMINNNQIIVKLKKSEKISDLNLDYKNSVEEDSTDSSIFYLEFFETSVEEILKVLTELNKNEIVEYAEPNFTLLIDKQNDPFLKDQWGIKNATYKKGVKDADMDVDEAWQISTGRNVIIAVVDDGVDLNHPDIKANLISPGYDATNLGSKGGPAKSKIDGHGTSCAGIIGAIGNNNIGIRGIAYNSKILPIRAGYSFVGTNGIEWKTTTKKLASCIDWAVDNNADIISNSWSTLKSKRIEDAIDRAIRIGRGGMGCIVFFAAGNDDKKKISFPASYRNSIAIGASNWWDKRKSKKSKDKYKWWGSNYGKGLNIVAPGVEIYTTDVTGKYGYDSSDYFSKFDGTSSSCPNAAGVAALILSVRPNLKFNEVQDILEETADKPKGYKFKKVYGFDNKTWNEELGHGRINAHKAVLRALQY